MRKGQRVRQAETVRLDQLDHREQRGHLVHRGRRVVWGRLGQRERKDRPVQMEVAERALAVQGQPVLLARKVQQVVLVQPAPKVRQVRQVL